MLPLLFALVPFLALSLALPLRAAIFPIMGIFILGYTAFGIADLSLYRGPLIPSVVSNEASLAIMLSLIILAFVPLRPENFPAHLRTQPIPLMLILGTMAPGVVGTLLQVMIGGFDFGQIGRFSNNPAIQVLIESLFVPLLLIGARQTSITRSHRGLLRGLTMFILTAFLLTGFRNFVVGGLIIVGLQMNADRRVGRALPYGLAAIGFFVLVGYVRQAFAPGLLPLDALRVKYAVSSALPDVLVQLHITARETVGITNTIVKRRLEIGSPVFFGDLLTLLPGKQVSGGGAVAAVVGAAQSGGLTIGLLGSSIIEYGAARYLFAGAITLMFLTFMRAPWTKDPRKRLMCSCYAAYQFLLIFHTGVLRPGIIFTDIELIAVLALLLRPWQEALPVRIRPASGPLSEEVAS